LFFIVTLVLKNRFRLVVLQIDIFYYAINEMICLFVKFYIILYISKDEVDKDFFILEFL